MQLSHFLIALTLGMRWATYSGTPVPGFHLSAPISSHAAESGSASRCVAAARAIREWGWAESDESASSSVSSIVAAVNYELRLNSGRLPAKDIERLRMAASSADPCIRELSIGILETQSEGKLARGRSTRLVKSVTPLSEKQSPTGEDSTP